MYIINQNMRKLKVCNRRKVRVIYLFKWSSAGKNRTFDHNYLIHFSSANMILLNGAYYCPDAFHSD